MSPTATALQRQIAEATAALEAYQAECPHLEGEVKETCNASLRQGNTPYRSYHCTFCDKRWTETGWHVGRAS